MTEYIKKKYYSHLIGERARFKQNLKGYCSFLWGATGTIKQLHLVKKGDLDHIGLSLVFDTPQKRYEGDYSPMNSCYIAPNSIEKIEEKEV